MNLQETYKQLEQRLVFDKAYIAPLYNSFKAQGVNKDILERKYSTTCKITCNRVGNN